MKKLMTALALALVSMILLACGSGGGEDAGNNENNQFFLSERVGLSCAEATNIQDNKCSAEHLVRRAALDNGPVPDSIFNSGDIIKSEIVWYELEAINGAFSPARLYIYIDEGGAAGCESRNISTMSSPFDINQRAHKNIGSTGTGFDICAVNGASWANVTIYNGSHLALDMLGDPAFDEALYTTKILWNFID